MENIKKNYTIEQWTIKKLITEVNNGKIELNDSTLQRREIATKEWNSKLIKSIVIGRSINAIHFAWTINKKNEKVLMCVDGLQRTTAILKFDTNKVDVPDNVKVRVINNNEEIEMYLTTDKKLKINKLKREGKEELINTVFYNRFVDVYVYNDLSANEIQNLFVLLNSGNVIKDQERRNAYPSPVADAIRTIARGRDIRDEDGNVMRTEGNHPIFDGQTTGNKYTADGILKFKNDRYTYDALIAKILCIEDRNVEDPTTKYLDALYEETSHIRHGDEYENSRYPRLFKKIIKNLNKINSLIIETDSTDRPFQKKDNDFLIFYKLLRKIEDNNKQISSSKLFLDEYVTAYNQALYTSDSFGRLNRNRLKTNEIINRVYSILISRQNNGLIEIDNIRTFNEEQRRTKWKEQGQKCAYTGELLKFEDSAADHIIPFSKGGLTAYWNLAVVNSNLNSKRGNTAWYKWMINEDYSGINGDMSPPMNNDDIIKYQNELTDDNTMLKNMLKNIV